MVHRLMTLALIATPLLPVGAAHATCNDIASGLITTNDGTVITSGFDTWGYNYEQRAFSGSYCDALRGAPCAGYETVALSMQWNEAWLGTTDCDGDGFLDRHHGFAGYRGSGAWVSNFMSDSFVNEQGQTCFWSYQYRAEAAPIDAELTDGVFYEAGGTEIGPQIWIDFAATIDTYNEFCF